MANNDIAEAMTTAQVKYALLLGVKNDAVDGTAAATVIKTEAEQALAVIERKAEATRQKTVDDAKAKTDQTIDEENQKVADLQVKVEDAETDLNEFLAKMKATLNVDLNFLVREPSGNRGRTTL